MTAGKKKVRTQTVTSLRGFIEATDFFDLLSELVIFRGQPLQGNLVPKIARPDNTVDTAQKEETVLNQLRLMGASFLSSADPTSLDLMVLAQHFGLATRLLDWTSNPLAALWFACSDSAEGDTFVYALESDSLLLKGGHTSDPFAAKKTHVFQPRLNNPRIVAQHGWFTLHRYSIKSGKFVPLENNPETTQCLSELRIPADSRATVLSALDRYGVSHRTLFPDLAGLCKHLNWKYKLTE